MAQAGRWGRLLNQSTSLAVRHTHPALFFALYLPFGAAGGYFSGALEYFYSQAGVSTAALGLVLTIALAPQVAKMLWAPLVDSLFTVSAWYLSGLAAIGVSLVGASLLPV